MWVHGEPLFVVMRCADSCISRVKKLTSTQKPQGPEVMIWYITSSWVPFPKLFKLCHWAAGPPCKNIVHHFTAYSNMLFIKWNLVIWHFCWFLFQAMKHFLRCDGENSQAIELAIETVGRANDDALTHELVNFLMGDTDGVPKVSIVLGWWIIECHNKCTRKRTWKWSNFRT